MAITVVARSAPFGQKSHSNSNSSNPLNSGTKQLKSWSVGPSTWAIPKKSCSCETFSAYPFVLQCTQRHGSPARVAACCHCSISNASQRTQRRQSMPPANHDAKGSRGSRRERQALRLQLSACAGPRRVAQSGRTAHCGRRLLE